ncbi:hypothetical protein ABT364_00275 [Massilia sp. SR12]
MTKLLGISAFISLLVFALAGCSQIAMKSDVASYEATVPKGPDSHFKAQVVGVQWLNPLVRRDYPTE